MKKIILIFALLTGMCAQAQWSVEADFRTCPVVDEDKASMGSDIALNYTIGLPHNFFVQPSIGFFYQNFHKEVGWLGENLPTKKGGNKGWRTGVDVALVGGYALDVKACKLSVFTGPRYGYAFKQDNRVIDAFLPNTLDWRVGVGCGFCQHWTVSVKCDIALLRQYHTRYTHTSTGIMEQKIDWKQPTTLAVGVAYGF